ncbi:MAG: MotA/TolQ/ExbB proton channel family protein [Lachnospiraceae bacterium]|nr:MotA/TolQ/ExbB proton channel family protein [Lachnospiraceae bacterium]
MSAEIINSVRSPISIMIIIFALVVLIALITSNRAFKNMLERANNSYRLTKSKRGSSRSVDIDMDEGEILQMSRDSIGRLSDMEDLREDFDAQNSKYNSWVQTISIFPLLGLLGTILGLVPGLKAVSAGDLEPLYSALSTALFSTFWGLIASILLKLYVDFGPDKTVSDIENKFYEDEKIFTNRIALRK